MDKFCLKETFTKTPIVCEVDKLAYGAKIYFLNHAILES